MSTSSEEQLLLRPERLQTQLSSKQKIMILDYLLEKAMQPIAISTNVLQEMLSELLPLINFDSRRKLSVVPSKRLINLGFSAIFATKKDVQFKLFQEMKLERGLIFGLLWKVYDQTAKYEHYQVRLCKTRDPLMISYYAEKIRSIEQRLGANSNLLGPALKNSSWWLDWANDFKAMLIEKYTKHAWKQAIKATHGTNLTISTSDLFKNYLLAISKAIDKFSYDKGALTSYIQTWFKDANINSEFGHQYGVSHDIPNSRRRSLQKQGWVNTKGAVEQNIAIDIEETFQEKDINSPDQNMNHRILQKRLTKFAGFQNVKMMMLVNGVTYSLTLEDLRKQLDG